MRATVVIVNYNGAHLLPSCLDGLRKQDLPADEFRTVVVDNASRDGSVQLLSERYPEVEVLASPVNRGFAGGNNLALERVDTPFAVLLNNDAVPDPSWLRELLAPFDAPGNDRLAVTTGKVLFLPRFVRLSFSTPAFSPGDGDTRQLGVRVASVEAGGEDVAAKVIWDRGGFGREESDEGSFWWTRAEGELLVPLPDSLAGGPACLTLRVRAEDGNRKPLRVALGADDFDFEVGDDYEDLEVPISSDAPLVDVINNAGGIVLKGGYGADRGFREIDEGQFDEPVQVFNACGNGMALRSSVGDQVGWFDEDFFMYYEDTDLSWRIRSRDWQILYVPTARLRHIHSATSKEWSPLWLFHVDRNRLLMVTKNATPGLIAHAVALYLLGTAYRAAFAARQGLRTRRRPPLAPVLLRLRVLASFLRLVPRMLHRRRAIRRSSARSPRELQQWLVASR